MTTIMVAYCLHTLMTMIMVDYTSVLQLLMTMIVVTYAEHT